MLQTMDCLKTVIVEKFTVITVVTAATALGVLASAASVHSAVPGYAPQPLAIPVPTRPSVAWETECAEFAEKMHRAFGIDATVALEFSARTRTR